MGGSGCDWFTYGVFGGLGNDGVSGRGSEGSLTCVERWVSKVRFGFNTVRTFRHQEKCVERSLTPKSRLVA